jgi:hypothetical protein
MDSACSTFFPLGRSAIASWTLAILTGDTSRLKKLRRPYPKATWASTGALEEESLAGQTGSCMKIAVGY